MPENNTITLATSIVSICLSSSAFVVSLMNYLRDRAKVKVLLQWDIAIAEDRHLYDHRKRYGLIRVTNVGRRPVFITMIALQFPKERTWFKRSEVSYGVFFESTSGKKLLEGDGPLSQVVPNQEELEPHAERWKEVVAIAYDSSGAEYRSSPVTKRPSWAMKKPEQPPQS